MEFTVLGCQPKNICVFSHAFRLVHHSRNVSMFSMFSGWYPRTVCCVQPGYMAASNVMLPVQERDHKNQNLLTLLGKCKECSELLSHLLTFVILLYLCACLCTLCVYHARSVMCISCFLRLECPHARDSPVAIITVSLPILVPTALSALRRILVRIYGSPDLFVKEYCNLLADRLLASLSYDVSREVCVLSV